MKINYIQINKYLTALNTLKEEKLPFRISLIIAKNIANLEKETQFFADREREFAFKYLVFDEKTGQFEQAGPGQFKIKEGMEKECQEARKDLDEFLTEIDLLKLPSTALENLDIAPDTLTDILDLIEE